ncbi:DUF2780 domain-containing protein [Marinobacter sp. ATCH36]|uniref:DUF2780 domain-containing protein n=1 Tax=Marinobacter sp. ATCH36 TaxID=2945106 RepID=UPI0020227A09|nr:DUF2780 domain-containing protein [Marinobacter sp. ATCH36]MCL7946187.1 DUF2780 domain-containing protein [Marinobacter sp. ATCH36]
MSRFVRHFLIVSSFYLLGSAAPAQQLNTNTERVESMPEDELEIAGEPFDLASGLQQQLGVSRQESAGAVASLLGFGRGQLSAEDMASIENISDIRNLLRDGAAGTRVTAIDSLQGLHRSFESTGLSRLIIEPMAVVILDFLKAQGINPELRNDLAALWFNRMV